MSTTMSETKVPEPPESKKNPFSAAEVEAKWTKHWFDNEVFNLDIHPDKPRFSCALPPPNITGNLHLGHALNGTLQDVLIRLKRMQGYSVLWQPGTDHAGISTQMVVEKKLKKEGQNRRELGREKFVEKVWEWRNQYGNQIMEQYRRLGVSFNWDRIAFTMDENYVKAIYRAFIILYKEGKIYRGNRITNWCPRCLTSVSDLEVEHKETRGHLYHISYALAEGSESASGGLTVATTRPESMFGDVAVAVHPDDERYKQFIGKKVRLPLTERQLPVIADNYVEREFGTGALKITPAHDANDWEVGQRHNLPAPVVIDQEGRLIANEYVPEQFHKMERFTARPKVVEELQEKGHLVEIKDYVHGVGHCERCQTVIEPYLSEQWYCAMKELAEPAIRVVEEGRVQFVPERYANTYLDWLRNIRDWNISRQLWWGHRIPVWTCESGHQEAYEQAPKKCDRCGSPKLEQDPDVLDTWFSSALWPFATLGWPDETPVFKAFYPTTFLSTAREIINLWVARMIFTSLKFVGTIPFKHVLIHPVLQTPDGKRMSKSKGNAIDPMDMIDKYGADANRFWFASLGVKGDQDVRFREDKLDEYKKFANKIWNAGKFVMAQLEGYMPTAIDPAKCTLADKWILHRYNTMLKNVQTAFNNYDFDNAARELYDFTWDQFCDWYVEIAKIQLAREAAGEASGEHSDGQTRRVLHAVFEGLMRALHPIMPFITEEIWSTLPKSPLFKQLVSVMFAPYPREDERFFNAEADQKMDFLIRVIRSIRNIRQTYNVPASAEAGVIIVATDNLEIETLNTGKQFIQGVPGTRVNPLEITTDAKAPKMAAWEIISSAKIYVPLSNLIDVEKSREKLLQRRQSIVKELEGAKGRYDNEDFRTKAPKDKVEKLEQQIQDLENQLASVDAQLKVLDSKD